MAKRVGVDKWLFGATLLLVVIGLLMVFSASAVMAKERYRLALYLCHPASRWAVLGLIAMTLLMQIDYRKLQPAECRLSRGRRHHPAVAGAFLHARLARTHRWIRVRLLFLSAI